MSGGSRARATGREFELIARRWLMRRGLRPLAQNYSCRAGELDLVMRDGGALVIVEVKYRGQGARVSGLESLTPSKQRRLGRAAQHFLQRHTRMQSLPLRFDLVAISDGADGRSVAWVRDAFRPGL